MPADALDYITIKGFKSIKSIERLEMRPINILIGANGSGKSNFIGAFRFLREIREGRLQVSVAEAGGADSLLHFGEATTPAIEFELSFRSKTNGYSLRLGPAAGDRLFCSSEEVSYWSGPPYAMPKIERLVGVSSGEARISDPSQHGIDSWVASRLRGWRLYHLHDTSSSSPMRKMAKVDDNRYLREDASNLPSFLYMLRERHSGVYGYIRRIIQQVAPFFEDFILEPSVRAPDSIKLEWRHKNSDRYFDVSSLSDGTLRFIALAALFLQPEVLRPSAILIDEPELGLHPAAITLLASLIQSASKTTQVIVATQSTRLLDHFDPQDVLVASRIGGATSFDRLESSNLATWLEEYSLGELWEKNEFGGRPIRD